jgi:FlaA1/EpsC-like NDP-sugar epimerase
MSLKARAFLGTALKTTRIKRKAFFLISDVILIGISLYLAFWLRFDGKIPTENLRNLKYLILSGVGSTIFFIFLLGGYRITWRFFGLRELGRLIVAISLATLIQIVIIYFLNPGPAFKGVPRSVILVDYILILGFLGGLRISKRAVLELKRRLGHFPHKDIKTLIIGAGAAGEQICREMEINEKSRYYPIGFIDDDPAKQGVIIHGVKVLGTSRMLTQILRGNGIDEILVAMPSANSKQIREIVENVRAAGMDRKIKVLPGILDLVEGKVTLSDIKEIQVTDLLGRDPVKIDLAGIKNFVGDHTVLITGAGGSIGSELANTVLQFGPTKLVLVDIDETELFHLTNKFKFASAKICPVIGDIRDRSKMETIFGRHRPEIVLHTAAYKHVPIIEHYPEEAIKTNVKGTMILADCAIKANVKVFVNISTDKAINPTSVMGATKRAAEELLRVFNRKMSTKFISVRFGNVIGSRGSVIPLFLEQIKSGGPVTITHPEMKRYFMATSEAVLLVLEAAAAGAGGETFVLDMGEPVKIIDMAREMIKLSGREPEVDIQIVFSGLRAGEKLFEEILGTKEETEPTEYPKIFKARDNMIPDGDALFTKVSNLIECAEQNGAKSRIRELLKEIVPTYAPDPNNGRTAYW